MKRNSFIGLISIIIISCSAGTEIHDKKINPESVTWVIDSLDGEKVILPSGNAITMKFDRLSGKVYGFAGCNSYSGDYSIKDKNLKISDLNSTEVYCANYDIERKFLRLLSESDNYSITSEILRIYNSGKIVMILKKEK